MNDQTTVLGTDNGTHDGPARRAGQPRPLLIGHYRFPYGDATSNRLLQLARCAAPHGTHTLVVNDWPSDGSAPPQRDEVPGIELITLRTPGGNRVTRMSARLARPVRVLRAMRRRGVVRGDVSVVLLPMAMMTLGNWAVLRFALRCPVVVDASERHDRRQFRRGWLAPYFVRHRWSTFLATRLVHRVIAVSTTLGGYFERRGLDVLVVPPQVDCDEFAEPRPSSLTGGLRLLYAGTPGRKDMLDVILRGISRLSPQDQARVRLTIAGVSRQDAAALSDLDVSVLDSMSAEVTFLGRVPRDTVLTLLSEAHFSLLVRPTGGYAAHGFPSKVPESLSAGCPVMLNYTSDLAAYVRDGVESLVLDGNGPEDVQRGIERALRLRDEDWAAMSRAARRTARESFDHRAWRARVTAFLGPTGPAS
ncbi:glycosyltransferase involved in cell wall biosynthesis [Micromonospora jinlongensis]|uniref:Glycosyltransferase involved in cell wall biosynthesis n=1 Tax=Micromonospora jinlongensis TaxID=1287877 RepID=A0A7Z0BG39_9ACTN|nr:glycosyltransferase [Micromonospora jinlongensis]NYH46123.1 glycosyltransferase involved in cell wall biosynthesis [Micromonospora jinlongensis]